jgi:asparagine N-glycosylation enzyme membrane subunit Stt3
VTGLLGLATAFSEFTFPNTVVLASLGIVMGMVGYGVGARRLGAAAAVISAAALIIGVAASQGYVPGVEPADHSLPAQEPRAQ